MLPWHQRRSRRMNSRSVGGVSSQPRSSSGKTRTSKPAAGVSRHEAVGIERDREIMLAAPAFAEVADIAGLVGRIELTTPVGDCHPAAPARSQGGEGCLFAGCDGGVAGVAEDVEMEAPGAA